MKVSFRDLVSNFGSVRANKVDSVHLADSPRVFADVWGVHFYSDLRLELELSAANQRVDAALYLRILQTYASIAEACGSQLGMEILEVQGERLHLFWELVPPTPNAGIELIEFARAFHSLASQRIAEEAPGYEFTLRFAADYGRSLILRTIGRDFSDSVISLGDAANRPAKRLVVAVGRGGVPAGHLSVTPLAVGESSKGETKWFDIDVASRPFVESLKSETLEKSKGVLTKIEAANRRLVEASVAPNPLNLVASPIFRQGFMLRADLDGFSARIRSAFMGGDYGLQKLVEEFSALIDYPKAFSDKLPSGVNTIVFPWAGDCANLFLVCKDYSSERKYLPNRLGLEWHTLADQDQEGKAWRKLMGQSKWVVAIAGGDPSVRGHGSILTANVAAAGRLFYIGAGWSWRRSLDAEQSDGLTPDETAVQVEDFSGLSKPYCDAFKDYPDNPSLFKVASLDALKEADKRLREELARESRETKYRSITIPRQRPYSE
jgi:hypothetical protein